MTESYYEQAGAAVDRKEVAMTAAKPKEVDVILPQVQDRIQIFEPSIKTKPMYAHPHRKPQQRTNRNKPPEAALSVYPPPSTGAYDRPARPTYAASARKVLVSSARGLMALQGTLASLSSLYVNESFEEGAPCQVEGCPLNPNTRVRGQGGS